MIYFRQEDIKPNVFVLYYTECTDEQGRKILKAYTADNGIIILLDTNENKEFLDNALKNQMKLMKEYTKEDFEYLTYHYNLNTYDKFFDATVSFASLVSYIISLKNDNVFLSMLFLASLFISVLKLKDKYDNEDNIYAAYDDYDKNNYYLDNEELLKNVDRSLLDDNVLNLLKDYHDTNIINPNTISLLSINDLKNIVNNLNNDNTMTR